MEKIVVYNTLYVQHPYWGWLKLGAWGWQPVLQPPSEG